MRSDSKHPTNVKDKLETYSDVESVHLQVSMHKHTCGSVREKKYYGSKCVFTFSCQQEIITFNHKNIMKEHSNTNARTQVLLDVEISSRRSRSYDNQVLAKVLRGLFSTHVQCLGRDREKLKGFCASMDNEKATEIHKEKKRTSRSTESDM